MFWEYFKMLTLHSIKERSEVVRGCGGEREGERKRKGNDFHLSVISFEQSMHFFLLGQCLWHISHSSIILRFLSYSCNICALLFKMYIFTDFTIHLYCLPCQNRCLLFVHLYQSTWAPLWAPWWQNSLVSSCVPQIC